VKLWTDWDGKGARAAPQVDRCCNELSVVVVEVVMNESEFRFKFSTCQIGGI